MDGKAIADAVRLERRADVLLVILAERPLNVLSRRLRGAVAAVLTQALVDDVVAVVIASDGKVFSAGSDLSELGKPVAGQEVGPSLYELCLQIENFPKPVIVAINGAALGAGLELAIAAHGRIALPAAQLGLPQIGLGLVPEAGTTQRLPRLVGAAPALKLMLEPAPMTATQALTIGLVDQVVEGDLLTRACQFAERMVEDLQGREPIKTSDRYDGLRDGKSYQTAILVARSKYKDLPLPAPLRLIECVEAAQLLPLDQGLAFEAAAFESLLSSPEAMGLRHAFYAERRLASPPASVAVVPTVKLSSFAVWGAADPAADLVAQALAAGIKVSLVDPSRESLVAALQKIAARQEVAVTEGRLTEAARDADWARLSAGSEGLGGVDLVLNNTEAETVPADAATQVITLGALPARRAGAKICLSVAMATGLVAELASGPEASVQGLAFGLALGRRLGWRVLFAGPGGPIDRRLRASLSAAIAQLEIDGLSRAVIAASLASYGIGVGARAALPNPPSEARQVIEACLAALANQGARLLSEGVARRPSDVDAAAILNGIFPRWRGGPLFQADQRGLLVMRADLLKRASAAPHIYKPDILFDRLIADGRDFNALNRGDQITSA